MGFLDDVQASINRGTEAVGRGTKNTQLKMRMNDLLKERQKLAAQLGAALYEKCKDDPAMREGAETIFDSIAQIDAARADIQSQMDALAAEAQASQAAAVSYTCPGCGARVPATDLFCSGCGKPIAEVKAAAASAMPAAPAPAAAGACANCGAPLGEGDAFCMSCGTPVGAQPAPAAPEAAAPADPLASPDAPAAVAPAAPVAFDAATPPEAPEPAAPFAVAEASDAFGEAVGTAGSNDGLAASPEDSMPAIEPDQDQVSAAQTCQSCGADVAADDVFCGSCGASLKNA